MSVDMQYVGRQTGCGSVDILVCQLTYLHVSIDMCVGVHAVCRLTCFVSVKGYC